MTPAPTPTAEEIERIVDGLTEAQRDVMLGHLVEITPEESDQLEAAGLKEQMRTELVTVRKTIWPITPLGLAVRDRIMGGEQ